MTDHATDRSRARALLAGEAQAFDDFFGEYFPRLYRFVLPRVDLSVGDAQDICQETLLRALRRLQSYRGEAALFTWMCRIAINEIADHWQRRRRDDAHQVFAEDDATVQAIVAALHADEADEPERRHFQAELCRAVQVTLDQLPGHLGDVLEWKYLDGLSVADIARRLNLSNVAAQSMLQRARAAFRDIFSSMSEITITELLGADRPIGSEV